MFSDDDEDDFEVVPQDQSDDDGMWDVADENEDQVKQAKIKSKRIRTHPLFSE